MSKIAQMKQKKKSRNDEFFLQTGVGAQPDQM